MMFTGTSSIFLPQKSGFSFALYNINLENATGVTNFVFSDTGGSQIWFQFQSGLVVLNPIINKIISTYSPQNLINITGFYQNNILNYQVNGIFGQQGFNLGPLNTFTVSGGPNPVFCDVYVNSAPINYSVSFSPGYNAGGKLTGTIVSDTPFYINSASFNFLGSNNYNLLTNTGLIFGVATGTNYITFQDIDPSLYEYFNNFDITLNTPFGNIGGEFISYRGDVYSQNTVSVVDFSSNVYFIESLFNGIWSGNSFVYVDNPLTYNLAYFLQTINLGGYETPTSFSVNFQPEYPLNNSGYIADYITGFNITNSGMYSGQPPTPIFSQYYYVTGIGQQFQNMLFCTGCGTGISVTFSGLSSGAASGVLSLTTVNISGVYGAGVNSFNIVQGYIPYNSGSGYSGAPVVIWGTGGGCYSLPDKSGFNMAQFQKISGIQGAVLDQAAALTGFVLTSGINGTGYVVTGLQLTNIGFGYSATYPPKVSFARWMGDSLTQNASGVLSYKTTGLYNFTGVWNVSYNFQNAINTPNTFLTAYPGYYSGNITMPSGKNTINFQISLTGLDNTAPISGLFTLLVPYYTGVILDTKYIYQDRGFNLNTGALYFATPPVNLFTPIPNYNYVFSGNQNGSEYANDFNNL